MRLPAHRRGGWRRLVRDRRGLAAVEMGLVAIPFFTLLFGIIDMAHAAYTRSVVYGSLEAVARGASIGETTVDSDALQAAAETRIRMVARDATFDWDKKSFNQFSGINKPEKLIDDKNGNGRYDAGDCWQDVNPNGIFDQASGKSGVGGADDAVLYSVDVTYSPLIPLLAVVPGLGNNQVISANTIVRRQPYAAQANPATVCL